MVSCPVGDDRTGTCVVCGDKFEKFFDSDREEWMYRDAVRVNGRLYHPACQDDAERVCNENRSDGHEWGRRSPHACTDCAVYDRLRLRSQPPGKRAAAMTVDEPDATDGKRVRVA